MPIYEKIQKVMQSVKGVEKDSRNNHANYKYAGHEAVTEALRGHFADLGIVRQVSVTSCNVLNGGTVQIMVRVSYVDVEDGTRIDVDMPAIQPSQTKSKDVTAQQVGQAVSYAVKNVEFKLFSLTGDTEPDADSLPPPHDDLETLRPVPTTRHRQPNGQTAQAAAHDQAAAIEDVMVVYNEDEREGAATATEAAKMLADRLKKMSSWFEATTMLGSNVEWIQKLQPAWQDRLEALVNEKRKDTKHDGLRLQGAA